MARIELICIGDLKFKELESVGAMYQKRINALAPFRLRKLREIKGIGEDQVPERETRLILEHLKDDDFVILLGSGGKKMDSHGFAKFVEDRLVYHSRKLVFVIGGFAGLTDAILQRADGALSFSAMTFPHDLFRVLFLEQLYRALTIIKGVPYHR